MVAKVSACIEQIYLWMTTNRLKLNSEKTLFVWLGSRQQLLKVNMVSVQLGDYSVSPQSNVCSRGVNLDSQLTIRTQRSSFYQLRQLRSIRSSLSETSCSALVHAFVTSRLDYCNSLLAGMGDGLIAQLQSVIRVAARLVLQRRKIDPISADIRDHLHWLPMRSRIDFKLSFLVYKCLHVIAPPKLVEMLQSKSDVPAPCRLRSTVGELLVARTLTKTFGPRSFSPVEWYITPPKLSLFRPSREITVKTLMINNIETTRFIQHGCTAVQAVVMVTPVLIGNGHFWTS